MAQIDLVTQCRCQFNCFVQSSSIKSHCVSEREREIYSQIAMGDLFTELDNLERSDLGALFMEL